MTKKVNHDNRDEQFLSDEVLTKRIKNLLGEIIGIMDILASRTVTVQFGIGPDDKGKNQVVGFSAKKEIQVD